MNLKIDFFKFYFFNTDFSITIKNLDIKLKEYLPNVLTEGSVSQMIKDRLLQFLAI